MLYVRYGSGCIRRQTASAARPNSASGVASAPGVNNASPSSAVRRWPSTAFCKMCVTVELKIHSPARQAQLARQHVVMMQARLFARPKIIVNDVGKVSPAEAGVQPQERRLVLGNRPDPRTAAALRFQQR